jgi:hypothetical protein
MSFNVCINSQLVMTKKSLRGIIVLDELEITNLIVATGLPGCHGLDCRVAMSGCLLT